MGKIVQLKVQKALGFPNRGSSILSSRTKLSLNPVIPMVAVQARIYTGFHRITEIGPIFHDKYNIF